MGKVMTDTERIQRAQIKTCDKCGSKLQAGRCRECTPHNIEVKGDVFRDTRQDWLSESISIPCKVEFSGRLEMPKMEDRDDLVFFDDIGQLV